MFTKKEVNLKMVDFTKCFLVRDLARELLVFSTQCIVRGYCTKENPFRQLHVLDCSFGQKNRCKKIWILLAATYVNLAYLRLKCTL